jgi:putative ABC transport system permease protein
LKELSLKILLGDKAKYWGLIFGVAFATLLMSHQVSLFIGLMARTGNLIHSIRDVDLWVMDPKVSYIEEVELMREAELMRVRSIEGVQWAVPFYKGIATMRLSEGQTQQVQLIGIDTPSLVGAPGKNLVGNATLLQKPKTAMMDENGYFFVWKSKSFRLPQRVEVNEKELKIEGICDVRPTFFSFPLLYVSYRTALSLLPSLRKRLSFILIKAAVDTPIPKLKEKIEKETGLKVLTPNDFSWCSIMHVLKRTGIAINFGITIFLGILIGAAITAQTFYIFVSENLKQFAAMKAIGFSHPQLLQIVLTQAAAIASIGYGMGIGMTAFFFRMTQDAPALKGFSLYPSVLFGTCGLIFVIVLLSVLLSVRKVFVLDAGLVFKG